ncbi:MAG: 3-dehydroquinate synthase, partial [Roseburia sp.]
MAKTIPVRAEDTVLYTIELERAFVKLPKRLTELGYRPEQKICIVTDSNVSKLYLSEVKGLLENEFSVVTSYCMQAGEENK